MIKDEELRETIEELKYMKYCFEDKRPVWPDSRSKETINNALFVLEALLNTPKGDREIIKKLLDKQA